jgi:hypothetical protein
MIDNLGVGGNNVGPALIGAHIDTSSTLHTVSPWTSLKQGATKAISRSQDFAAEICDQLELHVRIWSSPDHPSAPRMRLS